MIRVSKKSKTMDDTFIQSSNADHKFFLLQIQIICKNFLALQDLNKQSKFMVLFERLLMMITTVLERCYIVRQLVSLCTL